MPTNRGATSLKRKRSRNNPMTDYDRLPPELRTWVSTAVLPWRVRSVTSAYNKALSRTGAKQLALKELDRLQNALVARDALQIWGETHPLAANLRTKFRR